MYTATNLLLQVKESEVREAVVKKDAMATKLGDFEMASQVWRRREENTLCNSKGWGGAWGGGYGRTRTTAVHV